MNISPNPVKLIGLLALILLLASLMSCGLMDDVTRANRHIHKAQRLAPELFDTTRLVTIDTTYIETAAQDTTLLNFQDSLVIRFKDSTVLKVRILYKDSVLVRQANGDSVKVSCTDCLESCIDETWYENNCPDHMKVDEKDERTVVVEVRPKGYRWMQVGLVAAVLLLVILAVRLTRLKPNY